MITQYLPAAPDQLSELLTLNQQVENSRFVLK